MQSSASFFRSSLTCPPYTLNFLFCLFKLRFFIFMDVGMGMPLSLPVVWRLEDSLWEGASSLLLALSAEGQTLPGLGS